LEEIAFATGETELGTVLIARSSVGVCSIIMGSDGDELSNDLAERFPESRLVRDNAKLADDLHQVQRFIETPAVGLDLAFDVRGTPFQRRVWTVLLGVPAGSTITYAALASRTPLPMFRRRASTDQRLANIGHRKDPCRIHRVDARGPYR
jgi:methylated-DNA-[protein]-cysteine S-methyltransferase/AraC family transcriptional regulator of adaptative response/methylated-DNA-[protein]-cysteine methyltransferase